MAMQTVKSASPVDRHVGARVRMQRMLLGMSQTDLGQRAGGITFQQIQKYENGVNRIGASRLHLISQNSLDNFFLTVRLKQVCTPDGCTVEVVSMETDCRG